MQNIHYIYAYVDPRDNKIRYVGQGRRERWIVCHKNNGQYGVWPWLQHLKVLGLKPIRFIVIEGLTKAQADRWEIDLIDLIGRQIDGTGPLLNLSAGGGGRSCKHTAETKRKMSEAHKGRPGRFPDEETRRKLGDAARKRGQTLETRRKLSELNKGKPKSDETRQKMSEGRKGKKLSEEHRQSISKALKGRKLGPMSSATKAKISQGHKRNGGGKGGRPKGSKNKPKEQQQ